MARGRTRVGPYGRSQMQKGIETSKSFGSGFSKILGGIGDVASGVGSAVSQAGSAGERAFNRPSVAPVKTSEPGSLSAPATTSSAPKTAAAPTTPASTAPKTGTTPASTAPKTGTTPASTAPKTAAAAAPSPAAAPKVGGNLSGKSLQSRISSIASSNKIANVNKIYAGKSLDVGGDKYTIQKGDTLTSIAKRFPGSSSSDGAAKSTPGVPTPPSRPADLSTPEFPKSKVSGVPTPPSRPQSGPTAPAPEPKAEPVTSSGVNTPNISTPSAKPTAMAPDAGRQSTPSDSGSSVSVKPEPAPKEPEKKQRESGTTLQNVAESVQVGNYKYRIV